jgi:hypothetical protein
MADSDIIKAEEQKRNGVSGVYHPLVIQESPKSHFLEKDEL